MDKPEIGATRIVMRWVLLPYPHREPVMERFHDPEWEREPIDAPWGWESPRWHRVRL